MIYLYIIPGGESGSNLVSSRIFDEYKIAPVYLTRSKNFVGQSVPFKKKLIFKHYPYTNRFSHFANTYLAIIGTYSRLTSRLELHGGGDTEAKFEATEAKHFIRLIWDFFLIELNKFWPRKFYRA